MFMKHHLNEPLATSLIKRLMGMTSLNSRLLILLLEGGLLFRKLFHPINRTHFRLYIKREV